MVDHCIDVKCLRYMLELSDNVWLERSIFFSANEKKEKEQSFIIYTNNKNLEHTVR